MLLALSRDVDHAHEPDLSQPKATHLLLTQLCLLINLQTATVPCRQNAIDYIGTLIILSARACMYLQQPVQAYSDYSGL